MITICVGIEVKSQSQLRFGFTSIWVHLIRLLYF